MEHSSTKIVERGSRDYDLIDISLTVLRAEVHHVAGIRDRPKLQLCYIQEEGEVCPTLLQVRSGPLVVPAGQMPTGLL